ncbi:MAG TPA: hypothetical protein VGN93_17605 [Shinella sp.]|jgi:hypothetical protein|uniref:hypothetical protein n=1 Tax=Shinella sp. TaxID=1870904 RepID=UPI002E127C32|nr:hypothetical protein [Shinella sp.]
MPGPDSASFKEGKSTTFTADVADETDLGSAVTVKGEGYTITFEGNGFASKHMRRIRRNSVSLLQSPQTSPDKLAAYAKEARARAAIRWGGKESSTNSVVYLDLGQFCQFGAQIIKFLKSDTANAWSPYPANAPTTLQKHATVTIGRCLAYSHSGVGAVRSGGDGTVEGGVGITLQVTVRQVGGSTTMVEVCHYEGGSVTGKLSSDKLNPKTQGAKMHGIAGTIVTV